MKTRTSLSLVASLLVLAGMFADAGHALAQTQEACPVPPGVTPPPGPSVTAQQVVGRHRHPTGLYAGRDSAGQA